jgi:PE family
MSFVNTHPEALAAAATSLAAVGASVTAQNTAAAPVTTGVLPAAADEVSLLTAAQFVAHGRMFERISMQAAAVHEMLVQTLRTSAASYAATEAANAVATSQ